MGDTHDMKKDCCMLNEHNLLIIIFENECYLFVDFQTIKKCLNLAVGEDTDLQP